MQSRAYAGLLLGISLAGFTTVAAFNLVIDPQGVLGTSLIGAPYNPNNRYSSFENYAAAPERYDGLLFGSSRAAVFSLSDLSQHMNGAVFASFAVYGGQMPDHLAVLEHILGSRRGRARIRFIVLLLDVDLFGAPPFGNRPMQTLWHPSLSRSSKNRFLWRHITTIQPKIWSLEIRRSWNRARARVVAASVVTDTINTQPNTGAPPALELQQTKSLSQAELRRITSQPDFMRQLSHLQKFVALCSENEVPLVVMLSPLSRYFATQYDPHDFRRAVEMISSVVPVWDFGSPEWLSARSDLWLDVSHFRPEVSSMMLDRIFGRPTARADFGELVRNGIVQHQSAP